MLLKKLSIVCKIYCSWINDNLWILEGLYGILCSSRVPKKEYDTKNNKAGLKALQFD